MLSIHMSKYQQTGKEGLLQSEQLPKEFKLSRSKIMYVENKSFGLEGEARIGRVYFSKSRKTLYYRSMKFQSLKGRGNKSNNFDIATGEHYWLSGPRKDQDNRLYGGNRNVQIDSDIYEEYQRYIST
jgi:hypothetical protein